MIKKIEQFILLILILIFFVSCDYKRGYSDGYEEGHKKGYTLGSEDGYTEGHIDGTVYFLEKNSLPSISLVILFLITVGIGVFLYNYFKSPAKRLIEDISNRAEEDRQRKLLEKELKRKKSVSKKLAQTESKISVAEVFSGKEEILASNMSNKELEKFKNDVALKILAIKLEAIENSMNEYEDAMINISKIKNATSKEKANLYQLLMKILNKGNDNG